MIGNKGTDSITTWHRFEDDVFRKIAHFSPPASPLPYLVVRRHIPPFVAGHWVKQSLECQLPLSGERLASSRALSIIIWATGLIARFFTVTILFGPGPWVDQPARP
jgi:hypothetical protein